MARAMMTAVLMRLPDPGDPGGNADPDGALAKAGYNAAEPRDERGRWSKWLAYYNKLWAAIAVLSWQSAERHPKGRRPPQTGIKGFATHTREKIRH